MRIAAVLMCFGLVVLASSCAPYQAGMSYSSYGGNSAYYVDVSEYYHVPERDVIFIRDRRIPDEEIPVVFFIARRANVSPSTICDMRLSGQSWMDISLRFGLTPDVYYVPVAQVYGGQYEQVYTYYSERPRTQWNSIRLSDDDIVNVVNLRFVSEQQSTDPPQVMKMRAQGKSFQSINEEARARKHGNPGRGNKRGRE